MKIYPYFQNNGDVGFWVPLSDFQTKFDQEDLIQNRDATNIIHCYSAHWFCEFENKRCFRLPSVCLMNTKTQFLNGRHRISILIEKHVNPLPIAFAPNAIEFAENQGFERISANIEITIPDLPISNEFPSY